MAAKMVFKKKGAIVDDILLTEFNKMDADGNGSLDKYELQSVFANLGVPADLDAVSRMIEMADKDGNSTMEFEEFRKMFHVLQTVSAIAVRPASNKAAGR